MHLEVDLADAGRESYRRIKYIQTTDYQHLGDVSVMVLVWWRRRPSYSYALSPALGDSEGETLGARLGAPCTHHGYDPISQTTVESISSSKTIAGGACATYRGRGGGRIASRALGSFILRVGVGGYSAYLAWTALDAAGWDHTIGIIGVFAIRWSIRV